MIIAVIPAYNEATRIAGIVRQALGHVDRVLVVDDGSTDGTGSVARDAGAAVITHPVNCGAGAATMTGIDTARVMGATTLVTLDADEQHDPGDIPSLLAALEHDMADIVFANRFGLKNKIPLVRRFFNAVGNIITLLATGLWVQDSQCGFKVFGPRALREVDIRMSGFEFCTEIVREAALHKWKIVEVPVKVMYSEYTLAKGQSFSTGVKTAFRILLRSFLR